MAFNIYVSLERVASRMKGRPYKIDRAISVPELLWFGLRKLWALVRGWARLALWCPGSGFPIFLGKNVVIYSRRKLRVGRGVVIGDGARIEAMSLDGVRLSDGCSIGEYAIIRATGVLGSVGIGLEMGPRSSIGAFSFIGAAGGVSLGADVIAGQRVSFHAENHIYSVIGIPIRDQGVTREGIVLGDDCWVGSGAIFLDGANVGKGCVIAAGSVIRKGIYPDYSVIGGVPARVLKRRDAPALSERENLQ